MRLAELREVAEEMGLQDYAKMRKPDLLAAIREARGDKPRRGRGRHLRPENQKSDSKGRRFRVSGR